MANGLLDYLSGFGSSAPEYMGSLLGEDAVDKLKGRAATTGIANAVLGYLAAPKNQNLGLGRIIGQSLQAGMTGAQGVYDTALQDYQTKAKIDEMNRQKAIADRDLARQTQIEGLTPKLFKTNPAQYKETPTGMYVPQAPVAGAEAPNFNQQYVEGAPMRELIAPETRTVDTAVLQQIAALSKNPIETLTAQADLIPKLRKAGLIQTTNQEDNPFEMWASGAVSPSVKKLAQQYASSFRNNMITEPDNINKTLETLANMDEKYVARIESAADRKLAQEATNQLRADAIAMQGQNQAAMRSIAQQGLDLRQDMYNEKKEAKVTEKSKGAEQLDTVVGSLRDKYRQLQSSGGIVDVNKPYYENIGAYLGTTGVGQTIGGAVGTSNQSIRNSIAQQRPLLLQAIKNATGMSAKQMDSNAELQMYLRSATDPTIDIQANLQALDNLENMFGVTLDGTKSPAPASTPTNATPIPKIGEVKSGYEFIGGNPNDRKSWRKK